MLNIVTELLEEMATVSTNQRRIVHKQRLQSSGLRSAEIQIPYTPSEHSSPSCEHFHLPKRSTRKRPHGQSCVEGTNGSFPPRAGPRERIYETSRLKRRHTCNSSGLPLQRIECSRNPLIDVHAPPKTPSKPGQGRNAQQTGGTKLKRWFSI